MVLSSKRKTAIWSGLHRLERKLKFKKVSSRSKAKTTAVTMDFSTTSSTTVLKPKTKKTKYPEARVIVLDDNFNTFEHVAKCLLAIIPGMSEKRSWDLSVEVDKSGSAEVWRGNLEQAELYHEQLVIKGLTMAPIEKN